MKIAHLSGAKVVDGFRGTPPDSEIAAVVVDLDGGVRAHIYPRRRSPTINLTPVGQVGWFPELITKDIYVSGVEPNNVSLADGP